MNFLKLIILNINIRDHNILYDEILFSGIGYILLLNKMNYSLVNGYKTTFILIRKKRLALY